MRVPARLLPLGVMSLLFVLVASAASAVVIPCTPLFLKPVLIDTDGNGPTPATDGTIDPQYCPGPQTLVIQNPWEDCNKSGDLHNSFLLAFDPITNQILSITRDRGGEQENIVPGYDAGGNPSQFAMTVNKGGSVVQEGTATLLKNTLGEYTGIFFGDPINVQLDFVFHIGPNGQADYVSLPWSQTAALGHGVQGGMTGCGPVPDGSVPQLWIPLVNGVLDVNPVLPGIPPILKVSVSRTIPTLSSGMTIALAVSILAVGLFQLRRSGLGF